MIDPLNDYCISLITFIKVCSSNSSVPLAPRLPHHPDSFPFPRFFPDLRCAHRPHSVHGRCGPDCVQRGIVGGHGETGGGRSLGGGGTTGEGRSWTFWALAKFGNCEGPKGRGEGRQKDHILLMPKLSSNWPKWGGDSLPFTVVFFCIFNKNQIYCVNWLSFQKRSEKEENGTKNWKKNRKWK